MATDQITLGRMPIDCPRCPQPFYLTVAATAGRGRGGLVVTFDHEAMALAIGAHFRQHAEYAEG